MIENKNYYNVRKFIEYPKEGILSKELFKSDKREVTLFCMAENTEISDHTSTKEGFIYVLEGKGLFNLEGEEINMNSGVLISIKRNAVHSIKVEGKTAFVLLLTN